MKQKHKSPYLYALTVTITILLFLFLVLITNSYNQNAAIGNINKIIPTEQSQPTVSPPADFPSANIVAYVPITLTNAQNTAVAANTTIAIVFNAIQYQQYETPELNNSEFFFSNGTVAYSWLQGALIQGTVLYASERANNESITPYLNSSINSSALSVSAQNALSTSSTVEWWIKIPSNTFLPAHSSNTLYLGWSGNTITSANILMTGVATGEAPQLSLSYGNKDNGNNVFLYYSPKYNISNYGLGGDEASSISFYKIKTPYGIMANVINLTYGAFAGTTFTGMAWLKNITISDNVVIEGWTPYWQEGGQFSFRGSGIHSNYSYGVGSSPGGFNIYYIYYGEVNGAPINTIVYTNSTFNPYVAAFWQWTYSYITGNSISVQMYPSPSNPFGVNNFLEFNQTVTNSSLGPINKYIGLGGMHYGGSTAYYYGVRARVYPPNGIMPSVNFGTVVVNPNSFAVISQPSNAIVDLGQYETFTATVAGGQPPYTYNFFAVNASNPSIIVNNISFNGIMNNSQSWSYQVTSGERSSSPILANVIVTSQNGNVVVSQYSPVAYTINLPLSTPTITTNSQSNVDINQPIILNAYVTNGTSPYEYTFTIYNSISKNKITDIKSSSNSILWNVSGVNSGDTLNVNVSVSDHASTSVTTNSIPLTTTFNIYPKLSAQHMFPINASNLSSSYSLCAGAPGYNAYSDPGLRAGAAWLVTNNYIRCFRSDINIQNATSEGLDAYFSHQYGVQFLGILDYATVDSYLRNLLDCAYISCNWSSRYYVNWNLTDWNASVKNALAEYPGIHWWEIWNEPDNYLSGYQNHSALNYFNLIKSASTIIHAEYPNDTVVCFGGDGGGGVYVGSIPFDWWQQVWNYGASQYCNAVSVHYDYTVPNLSFSSIWNLTKKPIWESEIGVSTSNQTQYMDWMLGDFNTAFSSSSHFKKLNWLCSLCPGFSYWGLINSYPYNLTPMLKAFVNYSNTHLLYSQSILNMSPGQTLPLSISPTGGNPPYTYNFLIYNQQTNAIVANMLTTGNTFAYTIPNSLEGDMLVSNTFITDRNNMMVNSSFSDIISVANTIGCSASCNPTLTLQSNQITSGMIDIITATSNPFTDHINIKIDGNIVAQGTGSITYDANVLSVGNYIIETEDTSNGKYSQQYNLLVNNTLTVPKPFPSFQSVVKGYNAISGDSAFLIDYYPSGGVPPYNFKWLQKAPNATSYSNATDCAGGNFSTWGSLTVFCQFNTNSLTLIGNYEFDLKVTDSASNTVYSAPVTVYVGAPTIPSMTTTTTTTTITTSTSIPSGGGGGGGGTTGTGGGLPHPTVIATSYGYIVSNFGVPASFTFNFCNQNVYSILNFISPDEAGISINNVPYTLTLGNKSTNITSLPGCSMQLYNISYIPLQQTIQIKFFGKNNESNIQNNSSTISKIINKTSNSTKVNLKTSINTSIIIKRPNLNNLTISTNSLNILLNFSNSIPTILYANNKKIIIAITSQNKTTSYLRFSIPEITYIKPKGFNNTLSIFNISVNNSKIPLYIIANILYPCSIPSNTIRPFIYFNDSWLELNNYTILQSRCIVTVQIPRDPVVGLFSSYSINTSTTQSTVSTISVFSTIPSTTSLYNASKNNQSSSLFINWYNVFIIVSVVILMLFILILIRKRRRKMIPNITQSEDDQQGQSKNTLPIAISNNKIV